jgi:hypothetical protein
LEISVKVLIIKVLTKFILTYFADFQIFNLKFNELLV